MSPFFWHGRLPHVKSFGRVYSAHSVHAQIRMSANRSSLSRSADEGNSSALARTPSRAVALARRIPLPPSPAVIADRFDAQTSSFRASIAQYTPKVSFPPALQPQSIRATLSSPIAVQLVVLFIEAWGLRGQILPLRYLTTIPAVPALGISWETPVKIPDLFALLTVAFWGPFGLWAITSIGLPLLGAWFVNFRGEETPCDPVTFSVVKALVAWIVFLQGGVGGESTGVIKKGIPGGVTGLFIGAGIGTLAGLYESVLAPK